MKNRIFSQLLADQWDRQNLVCVGLDPARDRLPQILSNKYPNPSQRIAWFCKNIIDQTYDIVLAYKLNSAFYEAQGEGGMETLRRLIAHINACAPHVPVILDGKRGDVENTSVAYAQAAFEYFGADAVTVNPYVGKAALKPFLDRKDKGVFVLCHTSNFGSGEFQDLSVVTPAHGNRPPGIMPLFMHIATRVTTTWNTNGNCGLVMGATYLEQLKTVREMVRGIPILIPGIGELNVDMKKVVEAGVSGNGRGMILCSSRKIIFASDGRNYAPAARLQTEKLQQDILNCISGLKKE
jgi:orotidine-5'-phosphate decarboxylase